jgi:hypothetical protein
VSDDTHGGRIDRVETEVATIRTEMGGLKSDMSGLKSDVRGLGSILQRIEAGVGQAQQRFDDEKQASRLNPLAVGTVLLSIISILVGGAWLISGELSRHDERSIYQQRALDRVEQRTWDARGVRGGPAQAR